MAEAGRRDVVNPLHGAAGIERAGGNAAGKGSTARRSASHNRSDVEHKAGRKSGAGAQQESPGAALVHFETSTGDGDGEHARRGPPPLLSKVRRPAARSHTAHPCRCALDSAPPSRVGWRAAGSLATPPLTAVADTNTDNARKA